MFDRSREFEELTKKVSPFLEVSTPVAADGGDSFFNTIQQVTQSVEKIKKYTNESEVLHKRVLAEARREEAVKLIEVIEKLVIHVLREATTTRQVLKGLLHLTESDIKDATRSVKVKSVGRAFLRAMSEFDRIQEDYRTKYRRQFERQYLLIDPSVSAADLAKLSDSQTSLLLSQELFRLDSDPRAQLELEDMQKRNTEMHQLERGVEEVRVLFEEISMMVLEQADLINKVEDYVIEIQGNVTSSLQVLEKSVEIHRARQRKRRLLFLISFVILSILLLIILNEMFPNLFF